MLQAIKKAEWLQDHITVMLQFWINLGMHKWYHDADGSTCQALIIYQAMYCHRWHDTLGMTSSFNLKHIDQDTLICIKAKINNQKYQATEWQAKEVSPLLPTLPTPFLPYSLLLPYATTMLLTCILPGFMPPHLSTLTPSLPCGTPLSYPSLHLHDTFCLSQSSSPYCLSPFPHV